MVMCVSSRNIRLHGSRSRDGREGIVGPINFQKARERQGNEGMLKNMIIGRLGGSVG